MTASKQSNPFQPWRRRNLLSEYLAQLRGMSSAHVSRISNWTSEIPNARITVSWTVGRPIKYGGGAYSGAGNNPYISVLSLYLASLIIIIIIKQHPTRTTEPNTTPTRHATPPQDPAQPKQCVCLIQPSASLKNSETTRFHCTRSSRIRGVKVKLPFRISKVMMQKTRWNMKRSERHVTWP